MVFSKFKKMSKWGVTASVAVALLGAGSAAYAGFAVGSIGSAKGLKATPSSDVFGNSLDNLILGQLSTEDLDSAGIDYSACGSSPLPAYVLDYLETILSQDAEDTSEWQTDIDGISDCDFDAAVSEIGNADNGSSASTVVTASLLDAIIGEDGYVNAVLAANGSDISTIQSYFPSSGISDPATAASAKQMVGVTTAGFTNIASADAFFANSDRASFDNTTFQACYDSSSSYTPGSNQCTISKNSWDAITGVQEVADDSSNQLTDALITGGLDLTSSTIDSAIDTSNAVHLRYLEDCISGESDAITALSTCNSGFTVAKASLFYVSQIAAGASGYPTSALTIALLQDAGMTTGAHTNVGATLTQLRSNITSSGLTTSSTTTNIDDWVTEAAGFNSGTTYSTVTTATGNGWTLANYKSAEDYTGWTSSSAHKDAYNACVTDMTTCNYTYSTWNDNLSIAPTWTAMSTQTGFGSSQTFNINSNVGNKGSGFTITNISNSSWSASGTSLTTSSASDATFTFRIEHPYNSNKYATASVTVDVVAVVGGAWNSGNFACLNVTNTMSHTSAITNKCQSLKNSNWYAMLDGDLSDSDKGKLCDDSSTYTIKVKWGRGSTRDSTTDRYYRKRQYHGNGSSTYNWHSSEHVCPGSSGCSTSQDRILCTKMN